MKQLLVLSGKGGTGKTTVSSSFVKLMNAKVFADCDVDAPNMHLVLETDSTPEVSPFFGLQSAFINPKKCIGCGLCYDNCRFDAIECEKDGDKNLYRVSDFGCEGCSVCALVCPENAIEMSDSTTGDLMLYKNQSIFSTAQLRMGSGASGKLVSGVKKQLKDAVDGARLKNFSCAIVDGSPGIGCPVIASLAGVDAVLIVTEPSVSGISDMERILKIAQKFETKTAVCINKFDTNIKKSDKIEIFCCEKGIPLVGKIPFDTMAAQAINAGKTVVEVDCPASNAIKDVYDRVQVLLN